MLLRVALERFENVSSGSIFFLIKWSEAFFPIAIIESSFVSVLNLSLKNLKSAILKVPQNPFCDPAKIISDPFDFSLGEKKEIGPSWHDASCEKSFEISCL